MNFYDSINDSMLKFAVIIARHNGKWVFCKHKERNEYYGAAEPPVRCGEILPQLSVFAFLYYRTYSIINISKNMGEAVRCQVHTVHYV